MGYEIKLKKTNPQESDITTIFDEISCPNNHISIMGLESGATYDIYIYPVNIVARLYNTNFLTEEQNGAKKARKTKE